MRRLGYRHGDFLVETDGLGVITFRSNCEIQYDGKMKLKGNVDPRHPQEFVRAKKIHLNVGAGQARPISPNVSVFNTPEDNGYI